MKKNQLTISIVTEKTENQSLIICDLGLEDYRKTLTRQHHLRDRRIRSEIPDIVLIVEHPPVITLGARKTANKLLAGSTLLDEKNIDLVEIKRGGGATAHNPGQLVFYPILSLRQLALGINEYIRKLEQIGIDLLKKSNLKSNTRKGYPGLWLNEKKIASIGVRVSKFVTYHGMAININNNLDIFDHIIPCGLDDIKMTSLAKETNRPASMDKIKNNLAKLLAKYLSPTSRFEYIKSETI